MTENTVSNGTSLVVTRSLGEKELAQRSQEVARDLPRFLTSLTAAQHSKRLAAPERTEHAVDHRPEMEPVGLALPCQPAMFIHVTSFGCGSS